jgi:hypothetical protein
VVFFFDRENIYSEKGEPAGGPLIAVAIPGWNRFGFPSCKFVGLALMGKVTGVKFLDAKVASFGER